MPLKCNFLLVEGVTVLQASPVIISSVREEKAWPAHPSIMPERQRCLFLSSSIQYCLLSVEFLFKLRACAKELYIEISPTNRAGCQNAECKSEGIKIQKGQLRLGILVQIQENQTMRWKHW